MADDPYPFTSFNFRVDITAPPVLKLPNPLCRGEFSECDGLEMTMEPKTVRAGGRNTEQIHLVGPVTYGNLSLKRGMTSDHSLWVWFYSVVASPAASIRARGAFAQAAITMCDAARPRRQEVVYHLHDCLPIKLKGAPLNAKDGVIAIEEMQIAYSYFTIELGKG
jgi:phage tail-like protein